MNFNREDVFALSDSFMDFITNLNAEFLGMGINAEAWASDIEKKKLYAEYLNSELEKIEAVQNELASKAQDALAGLYDSSTKRLNALIGAIGTKCELGRQAAEIKNEARRHRVKKKKIRY
ncbi:MAG: hypothetical protein JXN64_14720 [Spirochaetes bacterium]|nr:hypothetical protein [Spirochaetota bacterium]